MKARWAARPGLTSPAIALLMLIGLFAAPADKVTDRLTTGVDSGTQTIVMIGLWAVEATLFVLTVAVSALLVNIGASDDERAWLLRRYRRSAFDWVSTFSLGVVVVGGYQTAVLALGGPHAGEWPQLERAAVILVADVASILWLITYSHHLLTTYIKLREMRLIEAQRREYMTALTMSVSEAVLTAWGANHDLECIPFNPAGIGPNAFVRSSHRGRVHDVRLRFLASWLRGLPAISSSLGSTRAFLPVRLDREVEEAAPLVTISAAAADQAPTGRQAFVVRRK